MFFSILFLLFMFGIPLAMVVLIIVMIRRGKGTVSGLVQLTQSKGWLFTKSGGEHPLFGILTSGFFSIRSGTHTLSNIVELEEGFWICDYHYISPGMTGKRRSSYYVLAVGERRSAGPDFWIIRRQKGPLGQLAEAVAGKQLQPVSGERWSWLLTSSVKAFEAAGWTDPLPSVLKKRMVPGGGLFLSGKYLIVSQPGTLNTERLLGLKEDIEMLRNLL